MHNCSSKPTGILETCIYCEDLNAARHFYREVVGLELAADDSPRHLFFRVGRSMLLVFDPSASETAAHPADDHSVPRHGARGPSHFAFRVESDQLNAIRSNLTDHGVAIESVVSWPNGAQSIYCRDPAGNSVEFATSDLWGRD